MLVGIAFGIMFTFSFGVLIYCFIKFKKHRKRSQQIKEEKLF